MFEEANKSLSKSGMERKDNRNVLPLSQINKNDTHESVSLQHGNSKFVSFIKEFIVSKSRRIRLPVRKIAKKSGTLLNGVPKIVNNSVTKEPANLKTCKSTPSETKNKPVQKSNKEAKEEKREPQSIEVLSWEPRAFLFHNFLSKKECEHLIKLSTPHLKRSAVRDRETGLTKVTSFRTSFGASLRRGSDEIIRNIEERIAEVTFMPIEHGENLNVIRYEVGQKVSPHCDYFDTPMIDTINGGQCIGTFLMYLSPAEEGGETLFPLAKGNITLVPWKELGVPEQVKTGVVVKPKMGDAVLFWNVMPDGTVDLSSLHAGVPVIQGTKWCSTKWMHARKYKV